MVSSLDNWDGSLSKSVRVAGLLDSNPGISSTVNKTTTIQDERINIGSKHGWQNMVTGNLMNDASNLNQPLSRDGLVQRTPTSSILSIVNLPNGITTSPSTPARKTFTPTTSTQLNNETTGLLLVVPTPVVMTVTSTGPSMNLDTISIYSADSEGEDEVEVEEITNVHGMLSTSPGQSHDERNHPSAPSHLSPMSAREDWDTRSVNHLFTPSPSPSPKQTQAESPVLHPRPRSRRLIMSHIELPPLKRPRSDYRPFPTPYSSIVNKRRVPPAPLSMAQVLRASFQHNADVGLLVYDSSEKKKRKLTKKNEDNVVAGPSTKKRLKRSFMDNDDWGPPPRPKTRSHPISPPVVVDLTITDDDERVGGPKVEPIPKPKPNPISKSLPARKPKFIHAAYNSETDVLTLCLEDIRPVPLEVLSLNTGFLRQSLGNTNEEISGPMAEGTKSAKLNTNHTRRNGYGSRTCLLTTAANSSSTEDGVEGISVGGIIWELSEEDIGKEVIEISSDSDAILKENVPQKHVNGPSLPKPRDSHHSRQQPKQRRQPTGDDVNRSSSTFSAAYEKVTPSFPPAPRPTPSSTKISIAKRQQPQRRKGRRTLGGDINGSSTTPNKQVVRPSLPPPLVQPSIPKLNVTPKYQKKPRESQLEHPSSDNGRRPPHSARLSLNGYNLDSGSDYPNGAMPSAKALGKRRAISPTTISPTSLQRHDLVPVPSYFTASIRDNQLSSPTTTPPHDPYAVQNNDFNTFINYSATSLAIHSPTLSTSYIPLDTSYIYDQSSSSHNLSENHISSDVDSSHRHLSSSNTHLPAEPHALVYNVQPEPGSPGESFFSSADSLYNDTGFPGNEYDHEPQQHYDTSINHSWSASLATNPSDGQYAFDTIDPTLLGGGALLGEAVSLESEVGPGLEMDVDMMDTGLDLGIEFETQLRDQVQQKDSSLLEYGHSPSKESSPSSSTDSSDSSFGPIRAKKALDSTSGDRVPADDKELRKEEEYRRKLPPRIRTKRIMPNMISHDEIDLLASTTTTKPKRRFTSLSASSAPDADKSDSDSNADYESDDDDDNSNSKPTIRKPIHEFQVQQPPSKHPRAKSISPNEPKKQVTVISRADKNQEFQMEEEDSYCHQCRRKTFYAKMTCSNCQKKFCSRCYAFRYPDIEFDADDEAYSCPACEGFCNCTQCCRKRGETYVGVRHPKVPDSPPLPPQRPRNTDVERVKSSDKTDLPRPTRAKVIPTTLIPKGVTKAWGSLYSVTGEKVGACFCDPSAEDKVGSVVFAPATTPIMTTISGVAQRVATEEPKDYHQREIRVKTMKRRIFVGMVQSCWRYTKPKTKLVKAEPYAKRSYNAMPRYYIGKRKYLFYPIEDDDSLLTPLDDEDVDEVKELDGSEVVEGKSFSPDSLGDGDVARAILLGLNACGVTAVEVPAAVIM